MTWRRFSLPLGRDEPSGAHESVHDGQPDAAHNQLERRDLERQPGLDHEIRTENGITEKDDTRRVDFYAKHLSALRAAQQAPATIFERKQSLLAGAGFLGKRACPGS